MKSTEFQRPQSCIFADSCSLIICIYSLLEFKWATRGSFLVRILDIQAQGWTSWPHTQLKVVKTPAIFHKTAKQIVLNFSKERPKEVLCAFQQFHLRFEPKHESKQSSTNHENITFLLTVSWDSLRAWSRLIPSKLQRLQWSVSRPYIMSVLWMFTRRRLSVETCALLRSCND